MSDSFLLRALRDMQLKYPEGEITQYFPDKGYGFLTNQKGERIFFFLPEVDFLGLKLEDIRSGMRVGYDVSLTSKGRRISRMRIPNEH